MHYESMTSLLGQSWECINSTSGNSSVNKIVQTLCKPYASQNMLNPSIRFTSESLGKYQYAFDCIDFGL